MPVIGSISSWHHIMKSSAYEWLTSQSYTATIQTRQTDSDRRVGSDKFLPISVLETWAQAHRAQHTGMYQCLHTSSSSILSFIHPSSYCLSLLFPCGSDAQLFPKRNKTKKIVSLRDFGMPHTAHTTSVYQACHIHLHRCPNSRFNTAR